MPKVLVITYYWPPAGGPGVQRWLSFTRYLHEFGYQPIVFIPENPNYPILDESLLADVPHNLTIYRQKIKEPYLLARLLLGRKAAGISSGIIREGSNSWLERLALWIRGNFFIPDARKYWVGPASKKILEIIEKEKIETLVTTGPPHSIHLIGLNLRPQTTIKWIADFRDPWTSIGYHSKLRLGSSAQKKHKRLEKQVLTTADKIITTSRTTAEEFAAITAQPISVITNGYEPTPANKVTPLNDKFTLSFIGSLLSGRNPLNLWRAISELIDENSALGEKIALELVGLVSEDVLDSIYQNGLKEHTTVVPYVSHKKALSYQQRAQVLLLLEIDSPESKGIIPGKLFEYMAAKRPILAIGPEGWEAGEMVRDSNCGVFLEYSALDALKTQLLIWFEQYRSGDLIPDSGSIDKYSRRSLTQKLAEELSWE